ncbi:MAG: molybdenum cofactor biosynthesis protein MoaE [Planctomycetia bacterium]
MTAVRCGLVHDPIDTAAVLADVGRAGAGANVLFLGTTRGLTGDVVTRGLEYEAHEPLAEARMRGLAEEAVKTFGLTACAVVHRLGSVPVGEASVAVATSAPHRREAFAGAEWLMERIKRAVPIWKCEEAEDGSRTWVHPDAEPGP